MQLHLQLVPTWRHAWKWLSVQAALLLVVISIIRDTAQHLVETDPSFEFLAHAHWYPPTMAALGVAIALLRLVHQPAAQTSAPRAADEPEFIEYPFPEATHHEDIRPMNTNISNVLRSIPGLVLGAEQTFSTPGSGQDKAAAVGSLVSAAIGPDDSEGMLKAKQYIDFSVWAINSFGPMFAHLFAQSSGTPAVAVPATAAAPSADTTGGTIAQAFGKPLTAFQPNPAIAADGSARA